MPESVCPDCRTEIAPGLLACPGCRRLVYSEDLRRLAAQAERAEQAGDSPAALASWREALGFLPTESKQYQDISARIQTLAHEPPPERRSIVSKGAAGLGAVGLFFWKFKAVLLFLLGKGKLLLVGLTKLKTLLSMFVFFGVYWAQWGWKFAGGFVLSMYIHEMGHVAKIRSLGIKADAPMFIPGLGAFVRLQQHIESPVDDARIGLAGPIWGLAAAIAAFGAYFATESPVWAAIGRMGAVVNLFNLIPVWQLDGGRGFRSLTRLQRWAATAVVGGALFFSGEGMA
ncbi:MAG TPA: site-2 protease family protein, partial [Planctomycetota bacterium]|nr:site-2 protease family protein [Planctomycetota bacterium]